MVSVDVKPHDSSHGHCDVTLFATYPPPHRPPRAPHPRLIKMACSANLLQNNSGGDSVVLGTVSIYWDLCRHHSTFNYAAGIS